MIKKIFLKSADEKMGLKVNNLLSKMAVLPKISFQNSDLQFSEYKKDEIQIFLTHSEQELLNVLQGANFSNTSYICSKAKIKVLTQFQTISGIGLQRHLNDDNLFTNQISLGDLRENIEISEPFIRDADLIIFDLNILRRSEVHNLPFSGVSGIYSEDASQMFRYAGMSERNKCIIIHNCQDLLSDLISQLIWYFSETASTRFPDHPYFKDTVNEYIVDMKSLDKSISFYKSKISGRWWVRIPEVEENKWKACSYEDYTKACDDEISNQLLKIISIP